MKNAKLALLGVFMFATSMSAVYAGGLSDPIVQPPVATSTSATALAIDGPYVGIMATKVDTEYETSTVDCIYPEKGFSVRVQCEEVTLFDSVLDEDTGVAGFVGYRYTMGQSTLGLELGGDGDLTTLDAQAGLALTSNLVAYGFAGKAELDGERGNAFGGGVDYVSDDGWLVGLRGMRSEDLDVTQAGVRLGYSF